MTHPTAAATTAAPAARGGIVADRTTSRLLTAGLVGGPLFVAVVAGQLLTRRDFDIRKQPISLLGLTDLGWIQISNFILAGVLAIVFAVGAGRVLTTGRGSRWVPRLLVGFGLGQVAGGVFVPDPGMGYPVGTPDGMAQHLTWHGMVHAVAPPLAFVALVVAAVIMARRFRAEGRAGWAAYSLTNGILALALSAIGDMASSGIRLLVAVVIGYAWVVLLARHLRHRS